MQYVGRIRNLCKAYAFIRRDGHADAFVHQNECPGAVIPPHGTIVEFTLGPSPVRPDKIVARDVVIVALPETVDESAPRTTGVAHGEN